MAKKNRYPLRRSIPNVPTTHLGGKIREARLSHGLTQNRVAEDVGVSRSHISKIELGKVEPSEKEMKKLNRFFFGNRGAFE